MPFIAAPFTAADFRRSRNDPQRPAGRERDRRITDLLVARLIAQRRRQRDVAGRNVGTDRELQADREIPFEDGERLIGPFLPQILRHRVDDLGHGDAAWRPHRQHDRDEERVARLVRVGVEALGEPDLQDRPGGGSGMRAVVFDEGRQLSRRGATQLGVNARSRPLPPARMRRRPGPPDANSSVSGRTSLPSRGSIPAATWDRRRPSPAADPGT